LNPAPLYFENDTPFEPVVLARHKKSNRFEVTVAFCGFGVFASSYFFQLSPSFDEKIFVMGSM